MKRDYYKLRRACMVGAFGQLSENEKEILKEEAESMARRFKYLGVEGAMEVLGTIGMYMAKDKDVVNAAKEVE